MFYFILKIQLKKHIVIDPVKQIPATSNTSSASLFIPFLFLSL